MLPQFSSNYYNKLNERIPFNEIYKNVIGTNNNVYDNLSVFAKWGVFWQLEMIYPDYWSKLNSLYRENDIKVTDFNDKLDKLAYYSSKVLQLDLSEHFERHGFPLTEETKKFTSQYPKPDKKIWYANYDFIKYNGDGFKNEPNLKVSTNKQGENINLSFDIDKNVENDLLGYEVYKNDELIAFTTSNNFLDTRSNYNDNDNIKYKVIPFDKKLNTGKAFEISSHTPTLKVWQDELTVKLGEQFDAKEIVKAYNYKGEDITNIVNITGNVDTNKKGQYELIYTIKDGDYTVTKTVKVNVVSSYDYLSDYDWVSAETEYGNPRKNENIKGRLNGEIKTFEKGFGIHANGKIVYDLSNKDFDTFEALVGVDMNIESQNNSSISFKILGDGEVLQTTRVLKHANDMVYINVPIKDIKELTIEISDAGNGKSSDHAIIVNPKLITNNVKPTINFEELSFVKLNSDFNIMENVNAFDKEDGDLTSKITVNSENFNINKTGEYTINYTVEDNDKNVTTVERKIVVYSEDLNLSDLDWESASTDFGTVNKDKSSTNKDIKLLVNGEEQTFKKGIGTHANSHIIYDLTDKNFEYFETFVGVDRNIPEQNNSSIIFKVLADGTEIYNSGIMKYNTEAKKIKLPIKNVKKLELIVNDANNGIGSDHGSFGQPKFYVFNSIPKLEIPKSISTKVGEPIELNEEFSAIDAEDGDLTSNVEVIGIDNVDFNKVGKYDITYKVKDSDDNEVTKTRNVAVVNMNDFNYLTDYDWTSTQNSYAQPIKDKSTSN